MSLHVLLTGGGSGGHITPLRAVAAELKRKHPSTHITYVGQKGDALAEVMQTDSNIDTVYSVRAGKFRRYHGEGIMQVFDLPTLFKNIRDAVYVVIGIWQSWRLLKKIKPDVVFSRGGFVSVPVGLGAAMNHIPYITHDSDSMPSLANRIIARWASAHAVALPAELYPYPADKTVTTGIPLAKHFVPVDEALFKKYRSELKISASQQMLFVIGGGLGSQGVNRAVANAIPHLLAQYPHLQVFQVVGNANLTEVKEHYSKQLSPAQQGRVHVFDFISDVYRYSAAADLIITRGGATNLAEFSAQGKACIVVPSSFLAGGHQLHNAQYLADEHAAAVLAEADLVEDPNRLARQVSKLLDDPHKRADMGQQLATFAKPEATTRIVSLIIATSQKQNAK